MSNKLSRHECRIMAFKLLFAKDFNAECDSAEFYDRNIEIMEEETDDYVRDVFIGTCASVAEIDSMIESTSQNWRIARMSVATRTILRLAIYEMTKTDVPPKVVLNEAIEIIKQYDDENAPAFINGILNTVARTNGIIDGVE